MYQQDPISTNLMNDMPDVSGPALAVADDAQTAGDAALVSLGRLRSAVAELFRALSETLPDERSGAAECLRRAGAMLEAVERQAAPAAPITARQGLAPWQVRRVLAYIDANLDKSIRNKNLAAVARLSEFHFNVAFRSSVGDSPHEYIIRRRIERAQGLMLSTGAPLSEIAVECGLADQAHFTRLFRRVVGETPAVWRRARANPRP
jgi:AraC family transcriptional regulator